MKPPIRQVLAESHIAAVAIAVLLLRSGEFGVRSFGRPLLLVISFLIDVVAIHSIPAFTLGQWLTLIPTFATFSGTVITFSSAWVLSRWVYGMDPFRSLSECGTKRARRGDD